MHAFLLNTRSHSLPSVNSLFFFFMFRTVCSFSPLFKLCLNTPRSAQTQFPNMTGKQMESTALEHRVNPWSHSNTTHLPMLIQWSPLTNPFLSIK